MSTGIHDGSAFVEVTNTGEQIPADRQRALFEPFGRKNDRTNGAGGHGLGLSITKSVAAAHRGTISARGRAGGGLDVTALLPVGPGQQQWNAIAKSGPPAL